MNYLQERIEKKLKNVYRYNDAYMRDLKYDDLTPELFEKLYFDCDISGKLYLFQPFGYCEWYGDQIENLITQKIADDILNIDIKTIWVIPKKFISRDNAIKALEKDFRFVKYVPLEYVTIDVQKKAIDKYLYSFPLIDDSILTDEIIFYALNKNGYALRFVQENRRTLEMCDLAVKNHGRAINYVPDSIKNFDLCVKAVIQDNSAIGYIPVKFLDQNFVDTITNAGVSIMPKDINYVKQCLATHEKMDLEPTNENQIYDCNLKIDSNLYYYSINIESLKGLFSTSLMNFLNDNKILTIGSLLEISCNNDFWNTLLDKDKILYYELLSVIKLLKCKYLGIDPNINISDDDNKNDDIIEFFDKIGYSSRTRNCLSKALFTTKDIYIIMHSPNRERKFGRIRNAGVGVVNEIMIKTSIVIDFYDEKRKKEINLNEDETIDALNQELIQIREEIQRLNNRTDEIISKIQEKMLVQGKGSALK